MRRCRSARRVLVALLGCAGLVLPVAPPAALAAAPAPAAAAPVAAAPARVVIVSMPGVTWEDVAAGSAPNLRALTAAGSMAALSVRTVDSPTDLASAFATIGAGNRVDGLGPGDTIVPNAGPLPGGGLLVSEFKQVVAANAALHYGAVPGAFGEALHRAGLHTGVAGNEDEVVAGVRTPMRFAALALADASGRVDTGDAGEDMSPGTALAAQESPAAIASATAAALTSADVVLVDLAEARRVGDAISPTTSLAAGLASPVRAAAVARDDATLGLVLQQVNLTRDTIIVLGTAGPGAAWPDTLTVAVAAGMGITRGGWLTSATTRRNGLVTLPDVAPGILGLLHIAVPASMTGQALHAVPAHGNRLAVLLGLDKAANAYGTRVAVFIIVLGAVAFAVFLGAWAVLRRAGVERRRGAVRLLTLGGLAVGAAPLAALAQVPVGAERWAPLPAALLLVAVDAVVVALALAGPWRRSSLGPPAFVAALSVAAIAGDLLAGSRGQLVSLMGYSPIEAGRFYGLSPLSFAVLATELTVFGGILAGATGRHRMLTAVAIGVAGVALAGAPMLGAKFGAILTLVPAFGLLVLLLGARRVSVAKVVVLGAAAAVVAAGAGVLDALRPAQDRTHIGRFVLSVFGGGPGTAKDVLLRKAQANLGIYAHAPYAYLVPLALLLVAVALLRTPPWLSPRIDAVPGLRAGLLAALAANVIALLVNDSGVAIPAMGLGIGVPLVLVILLGVAPQPVELGVGVTGGRPVGGEKEGEGAGLGSGTLAPGPEP